MGTVMTIYLKWTGTIASMIGAFLVALGFMLPGYIAFMIGSFSWLSVAGIEKDKPLAVLNGFFLLANIMGLYRAAF